MLFFGGSISPATNMGWRPPDWVTATRKKKRDWNVKRVGRFAKRRRWRFAVLISFTHTQTRPGL